MSINRKISKKRIIEKSWDIFSNNSFLTISMREIAVKLDMQKSLLYYYFRNKSDFLYQVISENINHIFCKFDIVFNLDISASEKIERLSVLYLDEIKKNSILKTNLSDIRDNVIFDKLCDIEQKICSYFEETIKKGIDQGEFRKTDPKHLSLALLGYLEKIDINNIKNQSNWLEFLYK